MYSCVATICLCEMEGNAWIARDRHGIKQGEMLLVDKELGTLAHYGVDCCKTTISPDRTPFCWIEKRGAPC